MEDVLDDTLTSQRFSALLLALFAAVALTLASVGIYSVLSYIVRGRSREIGIRTALGARTRRRPAAGGRRRHDAGGRSASPPASIAALGAARLIEKLVFGVSASDPLTLAAASRRAGARGAAGEPGPGLPRGAARPPDGPSGGLTGVYRLGAADHRKSANRRLCASVEGDQKLLTHL